MQGVAGGIGGRARSRSQSPDSSVNESQSQKRKEINEPINGYTRQGSEVSGSTDEAWGEVTRLAGLVENPNPQKKDVLMDQGLMQIRI